MDIDNYINQLRCNRDILLSIFKSIDPEIVRWKPNINGWSPIEILCHLIDEEREDFRYRTVHILDQPHIKMPTFNPIDWVVDKAYIEQDFHDKIQEFNLERNISIALLSQYSSTDNKWLNTYVHPNYGTVTAEHFLKNWLAHDLLHIKQITRLKYDKLSTKDNISIDYAGTWT